MHPAHLTQIPRDLKQKFLQAGCPACHLNNSVKAMKEIQENVIHQKPSTGKLTS